MNIKLKNINTHRQYIPAISALYLEAFPESERAPFGKLLRRAKKPNVNFFACLDGDIWAGFVYVVNYRDMSYIFYLAIDEKLRGRGCGTAVLKALMKKYKGRRLFLAAEVPDTAADNYQQQLARQRFYKKAGFELMGIKAQEGAVMFDVMGTGGKVTNKEYRALIRSFSPLLPYIFTMKLTEE